MVDIGTWTARHFVVDTRSWWQGKQVLISPEWIRQIDWPGRLIHLDLDRDGISRSPVRQRDSLSFPTAEASPPSR
jgi:hypothetical protein